MADPARVLIIEDEEHMVQTLQMVLQETCRVRTAKTARDGLEAARRQLFDAVVLDINLPDRPGLEVLQELRALPFPPQVVVVTARRDVRTAVEAMKLGAYDYLQKPFESDELRLTVQRAAEKRRLEVEVERLRAEAEAPYRMENIVGESPAMRRVFDLIRKSAAVESNVLIVGETGTGKELVARAIHVNGARRRGPFVAFNCARYNETLVESELFGHEAGAFTGARRLHRGKFEQASGGTLFLDEVALMPSEVQGRLLRVLEERRVERVGGEESVPVDVRIVAATNVDLETLVQERKLREDLYYRLRVIQIDLPPLRERKEDIDPLVRHLLAKACARLGRPPKTISQEGMKALHKYDWPGNVRELENLIEMLVALVEEPEIPAMLIIKELFSRIVTKPSEMASLDTGRKTFGELVDSFERRLLLDALERNDWNKTRTAKELGWHRNTIDYKMKKLGIQRPSNP